ncbi:hypothetical protein ACQY0O_000145 [Thecaphora frezii]
MLARLTTPISRSTLRATVLRPSQLLRPLTPLPARTYASSHDGPSPYPPLPPGFEKIAQSPTALSAIQQLVETLKKHGLDITSGQRPSVMQLMKIAANSEIRSASAKVMEELQKAGIDVSPERLQAMMSSPDVFLKGGKK